MINFILEYKWLFFIFGEIIFWGSIIGFLLLRYGLGLDKLSKYLIIIWLLSDLWLLALGVLDYIETGSIDAFQIVIVVVLIYVFTAGKSDLQKLDRMIKRKFRSEERRVGKECISVCLVGDWRSKVIIEMMRHC